MMLADHIMEVSPDRMKQESSVTMETDAAMEGINSLLAGYLGDIER
jgi:hypothetical protein